MLQNARMVIIYILNNLVYVFYLCCVALEDERIQRSIAQRKNWKKLDSEIKLRRVLFFYPLDIGNTAVF
jgi:hypothetical protein